MPASFFRINRSPVLARPLPMLLPSTTRLDIATSGQKSKVLTLGVITKYPLAGIVVPSGRRSLLVLLSSIFQPPILTGALVGLWSSIHSFVGSLPQPVQVW